MADLKEHRGNETRLHEQLYNNLFLLRHFYPTTNDFNRIFKKDMFVKSNKAAFFEVVYYLLIILNPERTKEILTTWPPYEIKRENKFRSEVFGYINELNILYEGASIPQIMPSHLISPGGFKFTKFMLKLSQLVVFEHLRKTNKVQLYCPVPSKNIEIIQTANLEKQTALIEKGVLKNLLDFDTYRNYSEGKAQSIANSLTQINRDIEESRVKNKITKEEFNQKYPSYPSFETLNEKLEFLSKEWADFQSIYDSFNGCETLFCYLNSSDAVFEHNKDELIVPNEILNVIKNRKELNLIEFFHGLEILLERKALELPNIATTTINENIEKLEIMEDKYEAIDRRLSERKYQVKTMIEDLLDNIKIFNDKSKVCIPSVDISDEMGVKPLSDFEI